MKIIKYIFVFLLGAALSGYVVGHAIIGILNALDQSQLLDYEKQYIRVIDNSENGRHDENRKYMKTLYKDNKEYREDLLARIKCGYDGIVARLFFETAIRVLEMEELQQEYNSKNQLKAEQYCASLI